jgi:hypothetical protein
VGERHNNEQAATIQVIHQHYNKNQTHMKNETVELDACTSEIVQNPSPTFGIQCQGLIDKESAMPCRPARPSFRSPPAL